MRNTKSERKELLVGLFSEKEPRTVNEVIDKLFKKEVANKMAKSRGWRFYVHLNKLPVLLVKEGRLEHVGETEDGEKLWVRK